MNCISKFSHIVVKIGFNSYVCIHCIDIIEGCFVCGGEMCLVLFKIVAFWFFTECFIIGKCLVMWFMLYEVTFMRIVTKCSIL